MVAWDVAINFVNYAYPSCPKELQWVIAGSAAGAATTIIGEEATVALNVDSSHGLDRILSQLYVDHPYLLLENLRSISLYFLFRLPLRACHGASTDPKEGVS